MTWRAVSARVALAPGTSPAAAAHLAPAHLARVPAAAAAAAAPAHLAPAFCTHLAEQAAALEAATAREARLVSFSQLLRAEHSLEVTPPNILILFNSKAGWMYLATNESW